MPYPRRPRSIEEAYERFQRAIDAVDISEAQRAAIYNAALDWNESVQPDEKEEPALRATAEPGEAGLRARIEALHPDGQPCVCVAAVLDMLDEPLIGGPHWDSNDPALRAPVADAGLNVERLGRAIDNLTLAEDRFGGGGIPPEDLAAEYARLAATPTEPEEGA